MRRGADLRRTSIAVVAAATAVVVLGATVALGPTPASPARDPRPNVLLFVTDDQTFGSLSTGSAAMPWFQAQLADPQGHWLWFPDAVVSTPLCCPSRATILTGRNDRHTGVTDNSSGWRLDDTDTLAVWLHDAGYQTGLVGKYLNAYPWDRVPYVPPGWDRWYAKENLSQETTYYDYPVVDQGQLRLAGSSPVDYATDVLAREATGFVREAPSDRPWFLYFAPSAPHAPWEPAPRDRDASVGAPPAAPRQAALNDVTGKPGWVRARPRVDAVALAGFQWERLQERRTLLAVDDALRSLVDEVAARGELDRTVIVFLSDNGYAYGEHRLHAKESPYEESIHVPFAIYSPWRATATVDTLVANLDVAPTIAALAGVSPPAPSDGISLASIVRGQASGPDHRPDRAVFLDWRGSVDVPAWSGIRTSDAVYIHSADGTRELYDLVADPQELRNVVADPAYRPAVRRLRLLLVRSLARLPGRG